MPEEQTANPFKESDPMASLTFIVGQHHSRLGHLEREQEALSAKADRLEEKVDAVDHKLDSHIAISQASSQKQLELTEGVVKRLDDLAPSFDWLKGRKEEEEEKAAKEEAHRHRVALRLDALAPIVTAFILNSSGTLGGLIPAHALNAFHVAVLVVAALALLVIARYKPYH